METIKEEKKADLEQMLNSLIEKGWKPFGRETRHELSSGIVYDTIDFKGKGDIRVIDRRHHHIRELVAKESGLWQFVCENNLVEYDTESGWGEFSFRTDYINGFYGKHIFESNYQYRLIESSLKDESELEDFLLQNIKIDG